VYSIAVGPFSKFTSCVESVKTTEISSYDSKIIVLGKLRVTNMEKTNITKGKTIGN
jgi:hypothetical protein